MEKRMDKQELLDLIETLKISAEEFWILSSSALVLRDLFDNAGDLDIAVTEKGLEQLKKNFDNFRADANKWKKAIKDGTKTEEEFMNWLQEFRK